MLQYFWIILLNFGSFVLKNLELEGVLHQQNIVKSQSILYDLNGKVSIHIFAWRRVKSLKRLCESLKKADKIHAFGPDEKVPLHFHVDGLGRRGVYEYAVSFLWPFGGKVLHFSKSYQGLPNAVIQNGWKSKKSGSNIAYRIMLEDDLEVSPYFFSWAKYCITLLENVENTGIVKNIQGCSFYTPRVNEISWRSDPQRPPKFKVPTRFPMYVLQAPCSWGSLIKINHWKQFQEFYAIRRLLENTKEGTDLFPSYSQALYSNTWKKSWKRYYVEWVIATGAIFIYPNFKGQASFTTNYYEEGIHSAPENFPIKIPDQLRQIMDIRYTVPLINTDSCLSSFIPSAYNLTSFKEFPVYDIFHNPSSLDIVSDTSKNYTRLILNEIDTLWKRRIVSNSQQIKWHQLFNSNFINA